MSSMRNAVQRRNHRERAQPEERAKWGLLEKSKDYKLRAQDFRMKKQKLRALKSKAADRNPDEFSFKMMSSKADNGRKLGDRGNKALSVDVVKLLKTQDIGYVRTMLQATRKEREKLEQEVVLGKNGVKTFNQVRAGKTGSHMVFVESAEEQKEFKPEEWSGTSMEGLNKAWNRPRDFTMEQEQSDGEELGITSTAKLPKKQQEIEAAKRKEERSSKKKRERAQDSRMSRLEALKARERDLKSVEDELETQRAKMAGTIGGVNKNGVKFKVRERKR
ncbi:putative U3 small nucleolar RNA-associated protein Utp11 [Mytilinidion resinicola]|uniref:U3 small nucleolar RNA-associated protein 11 n=1 Tax=Mytilinidion resinicola TaxID=574789 RepID=A0A6A6YJU8_9PEZI|nr:putative U3 small nucleolar RNA-associated protein Utp11 [Mytilinidion resinicola]KAF2808197.1 putative U3 small nucleolar RNA-associated protein Utp11 [Mytilinidion resinicola]